MTLDHDYKEYRTMVGVLSSIRIIFCFVCPMRKEASQKEIQFCSSIQDQAKTERMLRGISFSKLSEP